MELENFVLTLSVLNFTKAMLASDTYSQDLVKPGDEHELKLITYGNSFETFIIIDEMDFDSGNN